MTTWWPHGDHLATTWWPLGDHLVISWLTSCSMNDTESAQFAPSSFYTFFPEPLQRIPREWVIWQWRPFDRYRWQSDISGGRSSNSTASRLASGAVSLVPLVLVLVLVSQNAKHLTGHWPTKDQRPNDDSKTDWYSCQCCQWWWLWLQRAARTLLMTIGRVVEMSSSTVPILLAALLEVLIAIHT